MLRRLAPLALALLPAGCAEGDDGPFEDRPNVLLISLDSTRADALGCYGAGEGPGGSRSPNLDALAAAGLRAEVALSTTSWTLPSHVTLLSGRDELEHGVEQDGHEIAAELPLLAAELDGRGFRTAGFFSGPYLDPQFGFDRGFDRYEARYGEALAAAAARRERTREALEALGRDPSPATLSVVLERHAAAERELEVASHRDVSSERVVDGVLEEFARAARTGRPFFVFAHLFDPHYDYAPPAPHDTRFDPGYQGPLDGRDFYRDPRVAAFDPESPSGRRRVVDDEGLAYLRSLYAGEVSWVDEQVGRLLAALEREGLAEDTLVVVVGDHGDEFFEHDGIGHRRTLYEEVLRVPLLARFPGKLAPAVVPGPVSLAAVVPTVREALGLEPDPELGPSLQRLALPGAEAPGVLSRLVLIDELDLRVSTDLGDVAVPGLLVTVTETFRLGSLKLWRERRWTRATRESPARVEEALLRQSRELRARETLFWIDLATHPDEDEAGRSTDFSGPRAAAALEAYRRHHARAVARRHAARPADTTEDVDAALRGLGYGGGARGHAALEDDDLVLPLPGEPLAGSGD